MPSDPSWPRDPADVIDRVTGKVRVFEERCTTCVFWPGNRMNLSRGRLLSVIRGNLEAQALLTCHQTLPYGDPVCPPTVCNGFWTAYGMKTMAGRIASSLIGIMFVKLPVKETSDSDQVPPGREAGSSGVRDQPEEDQGGA